MFFLRFFFGVSPWPPQECMLLALSESLYLCETREQFYGRRHSVEE